MERYTVSMPLLPSALPPKGEASRYGANISLNLIALQRKEGKAAFVRHVQGAYRTCCPYKIMHQERYGLHCLPSYFIFAFTSSVRSAEMVP